MREAVLAAIHKRALLQPDMAGHKTDPEFFCAHDPFFTDKEATEL